MVTQDELFPELAASDPQRLLEGSARLALDIDPPFDKYIFVEKNAGRCQQLSQLRSAFPARAGAIDIRLGDANAEIQRIGAYFLKRLSTVFAGVVEQPGVLRNSSNNPLYLLCFAVGNERGKPIAIRIAKHLLKDLR